MPAKFPEYHEMHGRSTNGPTQGRTVQNNPFGGQHYFDNDTNQLLYYDSENDEWRPMGVMIAAGGIEGVDAGAAAFDGALAFDTSDGSLTVAAAGGSDRLAVEDEQSSSSSSFSSSS